VRRSLRCRRSEIRIPATVTVPVTINQSSAGWAESSIERAIAYKVTDTPSVGSARLNSKNEKAARTGQK
jgi:hypothetical protein